MISSKSSETASGEWKYNVKHSSEDGCSELIIFRHLSISDMLAWGCVIPILIISFTLAQLVIQNIPPTEWLKPHYLIIVISPSVVGFLVLPVVMARRTAVRETMLIVKSVGIQVTTSYFAGNCSHEFYEASKIDQVIINEGISMQQIIYYLAIILKEPKDQPCKLVPLFQNSMPRLDVLRRLYSETQVIYNLANKDNT